MSLETCLYLLGLHRLGHEVDRARLERSQLFAQFIGSGHHDDGDMAPFRVRFDPLASLYSVQSRHHQVEENDVREGPCELFQRAMATVGNQDAIPGFRQESENYINVCRKIIDD